MKSVLKWGAIAAAISAIFLLIDQIWQVADASGYRPVLKIEFDSDNAGDDAAMSDLITRVGLVVDNMLLMEFNLLYNKLLVMGPGAMSFHEMQRLCQLSRQIDFKIKECP